MRVIFLPEDSRRYDTPDGAKTDLQRRADGALGLVPDVVGLVGQDRGHVALASRVSEKEAEVPDAVLFRVGDEHEADDAD